MDKAPHVHLFSLDATVVRCCGGGRCLLPGRQAEPSEWWRLERESKQRRARWISSQQARPHLANAEFGEYIKQTLLDAQEAAAVARMSIQGSLGIVAMDVQVGLDVRVVPSDEQ